MHLHVVAFDIPFPADYGGVIDMYYKIKSLHRIGIKIHLHCFKYNRKESRELEALCEKVYYYNRSLQKKLLLSSLPFIVISRANEELINRLLMDDYPILFEGLHSCFYLNDGRIAKRIKLVRMHNIEHEYYAQLGKHERIGLKKIYFTQEAKKLKKFENVLTHANYILPISLCEEKALSVKFNHVIQISAFHANETLDVPDGLGKYCLYHGNLSVNENEEAALFLINDVFSKITIPLIIAGKNPSEKLKKAVAKKEHIQLKPNVSELEMADMIRNAQINILPAYQSTGVKLKLINALNKGRHCIVNNFMAEGSGLGNLCIIKNSSQEIIDAINQLYKQPVSREDVIKRKQILSESYSNSANAQKIFQLLIADKK